MSANASWDLELVRCAVCGADDARNLGVRGNREHAGADPETQPHVVTDVVQCRRCGFIYTNPMIRGFEHLEHEHYDDPAGYEFAAGGSPAENVAERLALIERHVVGRRLLDVGAGKGEFVAGATRAGFDATGVEPSARFCDHARETHGAEMHVGQLDDIAALATERFDVVTALHVLEHVDQPHQFVASLKNHIDDGGLLVVEVPNGASTVLRVADCYYRVRGRRWSTRLSPLHPPFHRYAYTERSLRTVIEGAGLRIVELRTLSGLGRDRVRPPGRSRAEWALRVIAARVLGALGNREFLFVIARAAE
jgi:2-polyprenyl-3-methyl-5-hydroxy-6-metoxy-1,4-benzoquinol methylase